MTEVLFYTERGEVTHLLGRPGTTVCGRRIDHAYECPDEVFLSHVKCKTRLRLAGLSEEWLASDAARAGETTP